MMRPFFQCELGDSVRLRSAHSDPGAGSSYPNDLLIQASKSPKLAKKVVQVAFVNAH